MDDESLSSGLEQLAGVKGTALKWTGSFLSKLVIFVLSASSWMSGTLRVNTGPDFVFYLCALVTWIKLLD